MEIVRVKGQKLKDKRTNTIVSRSFDIARVQVGEASQLNYNYVSRITNLQHFWPNAASLSQSRSVCCFAKCNFAIDQPFLSIRAVQTSS